MAQAGPPADQKIVSQSSIKFGKKLSIISQAKLSDRKGFLPRTRVVSTKSIRNSWEGDVDLQADGTGLIDKES